MTDREFTASARKFVIETLRETSGKQPPKEIVDRTTAKLVNNFKPLTLRTAK